MVLSTDALRLRNALVDFLRRSRAIRSPAVEAAFRRVPRHAFLPDLTPADVYRDDAIITHRESDGLPSSSSSQPSIMAIMLEQLELAPGHRVLEVGAGTGYNAALIREIVGPGGRVVTVDIQPDVAGEAASNLAAAGYEDVEVVAADGGFGHPEGAPYDRIIVTASASDIPPHWREQLVEGGVLVVPLRLRTQCLSVAFVRAGDFLRSRSIQCSGFMYLRGAFGVPERGIPMGDGLFLSGPEARRVPLDLLRDLLSQPPRRVGGLVVPVDSFGLGGGLGIYLALLEPGVVDIFSVDPERWGFHAVSGVLDVASRSLCLIRRDAVVVYGTDDAARRVRRRAEEWVEMGSPGVERLRVEVLPTGNDAGRSATDGSPSGPWLLRQRWSNVVVWFEDQGFRRT
jgi:protein-L-isoaspartate(D-aspartate) O-methyltransferase